MSSFSQIQTYFLCPEMEKRYDHSINGGVTILQRYNQCNMQYCCNLAFLWGTFIAFILSQSTPFLLNFFLLQSDREG